MEDNINKNNHNKKNNNNLNTNNNININKINNINNINDNIISLMLLNEKGKILLSRQYSPISKSKVLYHASFFHQYYKNLPSDKKEDKNNSLENKDIKYLYISLNKYNRNNNEEKEIILILIININFNIFMAKEIIKLLNRIIFLVINKGNVRIIYF